MSRPDSDLTAGDVLEVLLAGLGCHNYTPGEMISWLNDLAARYGDRRWLDPIDTSLADAALREAERLAEMHGLCPMCGESVEVEEYVTNVHEVGMTLIAERATVRRCTSCGWREDE